MRFCIAFGLAAIVIVSCKPRNQSTAALRAQQLGTGGGQFVCEFVMPDGSGAGLKVTATVDGGQLTNVEGITTNNSGETQQSTKAAAPIADKSKLVGMFEKPIDQHQPGDRNVRDYGKNQYIIGDHLGCFDITGVGPGTESYICVDKSMQVGQGEVLWVSNARYTHDLNVMMLDGSSCQQL